MLTCTVLTYQLQVPHTNRRIRGYVSSRSPSLQCASTSAVPDSEYHFANQAEQRCGIQHSVSQRRTCDSIVYVRSSLCRECSTRAGGVNTQGEPCFQLPSGCADSALHLGALSSKYSTGPFVGCQIQRSRRGVEHYVQACRGGRDSTVLHVLTVY